MEKFRNTAINSETLQIDGRNIQENMKETIMQRENSHVRQILAVWNTHVVVFLIHASVHRLTKKTPESFSSPCITL